jgi:hypothetical protein
MRQGFPSRFADLAEHRHALELYDFPDLLSQPGCGEVLVVREERGIILVELVPNELASRGVDETLVLQRSGLVVLDESTGPLCDFLEALVVRGGTTDDGANHTHDQTTLRNSATSASQRKYPTLRYTLVPFADEVIR